MVLLLNYLPLIIGFIGGYFLWKAYVMEKGAKRNKRMVLVVAVTLAIFILFTGLTNGYIPKNRSSEVKIPYPEFRASEATVENRLRSPEGSSEERAARFTEKTDWRQNLRDEEKKANATAEKDSE